MFSQLFGSYLVQRGVLAEFKQLKIQEHLSETRVKLGTSAVLAGYMTGEQADEINDLQTENNKKFGELAVEKGYLSSEQIDELLKSQGNEFSKYIDFLTCKLSLSEIEAYIKEFAQEEGFSKDDIKSLKEDNLQTLVDLYCATSDKYVEQLISIVVNNIMRLVSTDFFFGRMIKITNFEYDSLVVLGLDGDLRMQLGFLAREETLGIDSLAQDYAMDVSLFNRDEIFDAIGEFANLNLGLLSASITDKLNCEIKTPKVYLKQKIVGTVYAVPVYLHNKEFLVVISTKGNLLGKEEHEIKIEEKINGETRGKGSVLVVDDSHRMRKLLSVAIQQAGYNVVGMAANGLEAIELYKTLKPDIVTLDINMPLMSGDETLRELIEIDPNAKVIMVSASSNSKNVLSSLKEGAVSFITKPFKTEEIVAALNSIK